MRKLLIRLVKLYQKIPGKFHDRCKFYPTCSNYMIESLEEYGCIKGLFLGIKRLLKCNPFNKNFGYDPVIKRRRSNEKNI